MKNLKFNYLVIEDDTNVWANIKRRMDKFEEWGAIGFTSEIDDSFEKILNAKPQLIFSDWSIRGGNAFQILDFIKSIEDYHPYIIIFTGYQSEHPEIPQEILNNYPMVKKYLVKPIYENLTENLSNYITEAKDQYLLKLQKTPILIENELHQKIKIIPANSIAILQCELNPRRKVLYLKNNEKVYLKQTWDSIIEFLNFYKIEYFTCHNRKSIINKSSIIKISKPYIWLENDLKITVSRERWEEHFNPNNSKIKNPLRRN